MEIQNKTQELQELLLKHIGEEKSIEVLDILIDKLKNKPESIVPKLKMTYMLKMIL